MQVGTHLPSQTQTDKRLNFSDISCSEEVLLFNDISGVQQLMAKKKGFQEEIICCQITFVVRISVSPHQSKLLSNFSVRWTL